MFLGVKGGIKLACLRRMSVFQTYYYANAVNEDSKMYFHSFIEIKTFGLLLLNLSSQCRSKIQSSSSFNGTLLQKYSISFISFYFKLTANIVPYHAKISTKFG